MLYPVATAAWADGGAAVTEQIDVAAVPAALSALGDGVVRAGERYVVRRDGRAVAALVSVADLRRLEQQDRADGDLPGPMALVGLFDGLPEEDVEEFIATVLAARERPAAVEA